MELRQGVVSSVQSDGTATVTIGGDPEPVAGVASDSNYIPVAGQTVWVEVSDTEATIVRKNGTSPSVFAGARSAAVDTSETTTSTSYTDLATVGPAVTVTVGDSGMVLVSVGAEMTPASSSDGAFMSFAISGANTAAAVTATAVKVRDVSGTLAYSRDSLLTGLTAGSTTFTGKYKSTNGGTTTFLNRRIWAIPL